MKRLGQRAFRTSMIVIGLLNIIAGCSWKGANSLPLPGIPGDGPESYDVKIQLPNVTNLERNSRVRVGDVTVGKVTNVEREGWHALVTVRLPADVALPENATAKVGQTSVFGSLHIELAAPTSVPPEGRLRSGSLIPLAADSAYPTTEQTLAAVSMLLNGGGLGQLGDITKAFSTAFAGREQDVRTLIEQLDRFVGHLNDQIGEIIAATESFNDVVGDFAAQKPTLDKALSTIPDALRVLKDQRQDITEAFSQLGKFSALTADSVRQTKESLIKEFQDLGPVFNSLANAGPAVTRALGVLATFPYPKDYIDKFQRGDYANSSVIFDFTLSRLDSGLLTGTRFEGSLTELEMQWGRTIGQQPSPYTHSNPLTVPYHVDQGR